MSLFLITGIVLLVLGIVAVILMIRSGMTDEK
jgi:hypothetical protein